MLIHRYNFFLIFLLTIITSCSTAQIPKELPDEEAMVQLSEVPVEFIENSEIHDDTFLDASDIDTDLQKLENFARKYYSEYQIHRGADFIYFYSFIGSKELQNNIYVYQLEVFKLEPKNDKVHASLKYFECLNGRYDRIREYTPESASITNLSEKFKEWKTRQER